MARRRNDTGYVLVTVAALLFVLLGFVGLAMDTGLLFSARTQAQRAADAAALAGAFTFVVDTSAPQPATAENHAKQTAIKNKVFGNAIALGEVTAVADAVERRVVVTIQRTEPTFFAKMMSFDSVDVHVRAVAEAAKKPTAGPVKPWFIPNTVLAPTGPPNPLCAACTAGNTLLKKVDPLCTGTNCEWEETTFAAGKYGQSFVVKPGDPHDGLAPSQFFEIQMPGDSGGNDYRNNIGCIPSSTNSCKMAVCLNSYEVLTGNKQGPTRDGVDLLIGNPPTDTWQAIGQYVHADNTVSDVSKALVVAPIWDVCNFVDPDTGTPFCPTQTFPPGSGTFIPIIGFATLFIESVSHENPYKGDVTAYLVNVSGCGPTPPTGGEASSPLAFPVRLVRWP